MRKFGALEVHLGSDKKKQIITIVIKAIIVISYVGLTISAGRGIESFIRDQAQNPDGQHRIFNELMGTSAKIISCAG